MRARESTQRVILPGGYVDAQGVAHAEVELAPLTGAAEEDLLETSDESAAALTTALLVRTIRRIGSIRRITADLVQDLLVQDREYLVVRLLELTLRRKLWVRLECPNEACGSPMEISLDLHELPVVRRPASQLYHTMDATFEFRLPNGHDQEWAAAQSGDNLALGILARLVRNRRSKRQPSPAQLDRAMAQGIEARMLELAPDVTPELSAVCPDCRQPFGSEVDLTFVALTELRNATLKLDEEVHILAWHYHWPESEILAMPQQKRRRYVELIHDQLEMA